MQKGPQSFPTQSQRTKETSPQPGRVLLRSLISLKSDDRQTEHGIVGVVTQVGEGVRKICVGDRVVTAATPHEFISVSVDQCAIVPGCVSDEMATFTPIASMALQGIRLAEPTLGEAFVVNGLNAVGLLAAQLLHLNGCRVLAIDEDNERLSVARGFGADTANASTSEDVESTCQKFSRGRGVDGVLLTSRSCSSGTIQQAARFCRKRGRIVLVGRDGLTADQITFADKELAVRSSHSSGPQFDGGLSGRPELSLPIGFVRWSSQRQYRAVLDAMAAGNVQTEPLVRHRMAYTEIGRGAQLLRSDDHAVALLLSFATEDSATPQATVERTWIVPTADRSASARETSKAIVLPGCSDILKQALVAALRNHGIEFELRQDAARNHSDDICEAIAAGHHVFADSLLVEHHVDLSRLLDVYSSQVEKGHAPIVMPAYYRQFSPQVRDIKSLLQGMTAPKVFVMSVQEGQVDARPAASSDDRSADRVARVAHFVSLLRDLAGSAISAVQATRTSNSTAGERHGQLSVTLSFQDGSIGTVHLLSGQAKQRRERLEVFCGGRILQLENFRSLEAWGWPNISKTKTREIDRGEAACAQAFCEAVAANDDSPYPLQQLAEMASVCRDIRQSLESGTRIECAEVIAQSSSDEDRTTAIDASGYSRQTDEQARSAA